MSEREDNGVAASEGSTAGALNQPKAPTRDRPILFSAPMIRALLDGRKTQTRRIIKPIPFNREGDTVDINIASAARYMRGSDGRMYYQFDHPKGGPLTGHLARFAKGDRLWVKETHRVASWSEDGEVWITYDADGSRSRALESPDEEFLERLCAKLDKAGVPTKNNGFYGDDIPENLLRRVSIHMPRWASRLTLTVTDVRVQRLQEISAADCAAEGACDLDADHNNAQRAYRDIWEQINGLNSWLFNPWVVAVTFSVERRNIDEVGDGRGSEPASA